MTMTETVERKIDEHRTNINRILTTAEGEQRELSDPERATVDILLGHVRECRERIITFRDDEKRQAAIAETMAGYSAPGRVTREALTYTPETSRQGTSYFRDLVLRQTRNDSGAHERLARHAREVEVETRDISRVDGAGGEFVPPAWLMESYAEMARAPRVVGRLMTSLPLPHGTDQVTIPKITTGPQVAIQTADNANVTEVDLVSTSVVAPVRTIAGQQDVAIQLLEQSPAGFDNIVFAELVADYERVLDLQLLSGTNASGQLQGVLGLSGTSAITFTQASPTVPLTYDPLHKAVAAIVAARQLPPEAAVTNGRWWAWVAAALDSSNRPLVVPNSAGPTNAFGSTSAPANGIVGNLGVVPFAATTSVPVNLGAGTNETRIIVGRWSDSFLYESEMRTRVLPDVGSGTLTVRLQAYRYAAVAHRFPASFAIIAGTGMVLASGY